MTNLKIPACRVHHHHGGVQLILREQEKISRRHVEQVLANLKKVEAAMGMKFGDAENPLLLSVRSGSKFSMPGMMDTMLNLGLNDATMKAVEKTATTGSRSTPTGG